MRATICSSAGGGCRCGRSHRGGRSVTTSKSQVTPREFVVIVLLDGMIRQLQGEEYWQVFWDCLRCEFALCPLVRFPYKHNRS